LPSRAGIKKCIFLDVGDLIGWEGEYLGMGELLRKGGQRTVGEGKGEAPGIMNRSTLGRAPANFQT